MKSKFSCTLLLNFLSLYCFAFCNSSCSAHATRLQSTKLTLHNKQSVRAEMKSYDSERAEIDIKHKSAAYRPPAVATSAIIEHYDSQDNLNGIVLIERCNPPLGKALPGGMIEYGESALSALKREILEETKLILYDIKQFHTYSDPTRDSRFHAIDIVHCAKAKGETCAGTDAREVYITPIEAIPWHELVFDHAQILKDYCKSKDFLLSGEDL